MDAAFEPAGAHVPLPAPQKANMLAQGKVQT